MKGTQTCNAMARLVALLLCTISQKVGVQAKRAATTPNLVMVLMDDLGNYDVGFTGNDDRAKYTSTATELAKNGIILTAHYTHYWCSPSRRSFLSGRLPVHHGEMLSWGPGPTSLLRAQDDLDLRWSLISTKLKSANYMNYYLGKGHTGYKSIRHLPIHQDFDEHLGFLVGEQSYTSNRRWHNEFPYATTEYSSDLYAKGAADVIRNHPSDKPFFLYMAFQVAHLPYEPVPGWDDNDTEEGKYVGMINRSDADLRLLCDAIKEKGMWDNTLLVYSSDNGGRDEGINYPFRGEKRTNFEGGMRVAAFVSGGYLPQHLRGTQNSIRFHIVDWYTTFCKLAGVEDCTDNSDIPPLPVDPNDPGKDIYGTEAYPGVDGVDIWDMLVNKDKYTTTAAHHTIVLSKEVIISGNYKLLTAQRGNTMQPHPLTHGEETWQDPTGKWFVPDGWVQTCGFPVYNIYGQTTGQFKPCLFDLTADRNETTDLSDVGHETMVRLWTLLNTTWLEYFHSRSPDALLGPCNMECAEKYWFNNTNSDNYGTQGPYCGVPGCPAANTSEPRHIS
eukprot:m.54816 g.54816  ORF g.54816 m.54816 type:complete len:557 (+) comp15529_c0_seq2:411-2081(+)